MTQVWDDQNRVVPVTVLKVTPARVVQVKRPDTDGYSAVQVTYGSKKAKSLTKPEAGHFTKNGVEPGTKPVDPRVDDSSEYTVAQEPTVELPAPRDTINDHALTPATGIPGAM